jgi:hypothetical protein
VDRLEIVIANLVAIAALFWLFDGPYRKYRLDLMRFYVRRARDDLFSAAESGRIPFNHSAYGMTRQMLNGMIRFGHELGFWRGVALVLFRRWLANPAESKRFWANYTDAVMSLPLHARKEVIRAQTEANIAVFSYLCHTSLLLFPITFVGKWIVRSAYRMSGLARKARKAIPMSAKQMLDHHAYECGA